MAKAASAKKPSSKSTMPTSKAARDKPRKYEDKSAGQPDLIPIFEEIKKLMLPYAGGHLVIRGDKPGTFHLWSDKSIIVAGRKHEDVYFTGLMVQKGFVGFYLMPVYACVDLLKQLQPDLAKCLKGKSCFHIKKNNPELMQQIKDALKIGYDYYKKMDWV